jgi:hypothetical protein
LYPNTSIQTTGIDAAILKSFGFGQAGAEILLINPKRLLACLTPMHRARCVLNPLHAARTTPPHPHQYDPATTSLLSFFLPLLPQLRRKTERSRGASIPLFPGRHHEPKAVDQREGARAVHG